MNPYMKRIANKAAGAHGRLSERRVVAGMGARATPASGALPGAKGDATLGNYRLELKATTQKAMALELAWLAKIAHEASTKGQVPGVVISFVTPEGMPKLKTNAEWVLIPRWAFLELLGSEGLGGQDE